MKKSISIAALVGGALLFASTTLWAADDERGALSDVWLVMPKQGMRLQFEEALRSHVAYRRDKNDSRNWSAYSSALGDNPMLYQIRAGNLHWGDQDSYIAEDQEKGFAQHWFENVDEFVDHYHHYFEAAEYESSHWPDDLAQHPYYGVTTWTWKTGAGMAPDDARKELSTIAMESGWADEGNHWVWLNRVGGAPQLMLVSPYESYADMAPPETEFFAVVSDHLGSADLAQALFSRFSSGLSDSSYTVWSYRPDLSATETMAASSED